jgi:hypothetical protein
MRAIDIDFPLMCHPLVSNESSLRFIWINLPTKSLLELVVIGGGDPAAFHVS